MKINEQGSLADMQIKKQMLPAKHELWFALRQFRFFGNNTIMLNYKAAETSVMLQTCIIKKKSRCLHFFKYVLHSEVKGDDVICSS